MRHVHEGKPHWWFGGLGSCGQAKGIHERQCEGKARAFQPGATIDKGKVIHGSHVLIHSFV
jgi:hypothetical protein